MQPITESFGKITLKRSESGAYTLLRKTSHGIDSYLYHSFKPGAPSTFDSATAYVGATKAEKTQINDYLTQLKKS